MASRVTRWSPRRPNIKGPSWRVRHLYLNVVASVVLYADSGWASGPRTVGREDFGPRPARTKIVRVYPALSRRLGEQEGMWAYVPVGEVLAGHKLLW